jgi:catechol 2,3-dioxygenase-like lactoylglutathione lyase family enzyme
MRPTTINGVRTIGIKVRDQDAATEFYVAALGFEKRFDAPISATARWIEVAPPGSPTSIALNVSDGDPSTAADTGVRFTVPDAEAEQAAMRERGVNVGVVLHMEGVPPMFTFHDPDGNRFYVVEEWSPPAS